MDLILVGGGPRSVIQANSDMVFMLLYRKHFEQLAELGAKYDISTTIYEKQPKLGGGMAFSAGHVGMANTPVEHDVQFPIVVQNDTPEKKMYKMLLSYRYRYERRFSGRSHEKYLSELADVNLPGAVMFKRAMSAMSSTPEGIIDQDKAFLMRRSVGEEELDTFMHIRHIASSIPFYKLRVSPNTVVRHIEVIGPRKAAILSEEVNSENYFSHEADLVRLNTGTVLTNPIREPRVKEFTFCRQMNAHDLKSFLASKNMLLEDRKLKTGKKIISGGLSLSGLDQIAAISTIMNLFEEDDSSLLGYKVTEFARRNYQGALSFINRTQGSCTVPRHSFTYHWRQETAVVGATENLHALFLHNNAEDVFRVWYDILECNIARAAGSTPLEMSSSVRTEDQLRSQFEETKWHLYCRRMAGVCEMEGDMVGKDRFLTHSTQTLYGAKCQAFLSLAIGFGLEGEREARKVMEKLAPITWKGRQGYMYYSAQVAALTNSATASKVSNMPLVKRLNEIMRHIVASPAEVHSMFHLLIEAGIAKYIQAPYSAISRDSKTGCLDLNGELFGAVLVSPVFNRENDIKLKSLTSQVMSVEESNGSIPKVGWFRRFSDQKGNPVPIECNNLLGMGFVRRALDGNDALLSGFGFDVNNRDSAVNEAPSFTMRRMALAHLQASGLDSSSVLDNIYRKQVATEKEYESEVQQFEKHFRTAYEIWAYMRAIKVIAGLNKNVFSVLYDKGYTLESRQSTMQNMAESGILVQQKAAGGYFYDVMAIPAFNPPTRDEFFQRFTDATREEHACAYKRALEVCRSHLQRCAEES